MNSSIRHSYEFVRNLHKFRTHFERISSEFIQNHATITLVRPLICATTQSTPAPQCTPACTLATGKKGSGLCCILISVSCDIGTAALGFEGVACRLEAVFLYSSRTFVH